MTGASRRRGLVMVFTGNGKGKTTAALGLTLRAAGHDMRVLVIQFIKNARCGELVAIQRLAPQVQLVRHGAGFTWRARGEEQKERQRKAAGAALEAAREAIAGGDYDIVVLDELCTSIGVELVSTADALALIELRPPAMHLVLTGRNAPTELIERADLVTEMREVKHPYHTGVTAQKGVEF